MNVKHEGMVCAPKSHKIAIRRNEWNDCKIHSNAMELNNIGRVVSCTIDQQNNDRNVRIANSHTPIGQSVIEKLLWKQTFIKIHSYHFGLLVLPPHVHNTHLILSGEKIPLISIFLMEIIKQIWQTIDDVIWIYIQSANKN